jgi:sigma-B regulation protein RsbU (phosphoserine phosphatase)
MSILPVSANPAKKILLVEDNLVVLRLLQYSLTKAGYSCLMAEAPKEAFLILEKEIPDIIVSDYQMPDMNGFDFRQSLQKNPRWIDIPFVFLTSFDDYNHTIEGLKLNALDYISKETPMPVIVSKISNILNSLDKEHERSVEELRRAAEALNFKSFPTKSPEIDSFTISFWHKGYQNYPGGDFIDFIPVDDRYCFVVLGDIMGKKWKAWFFTFGLISYIRAAIRFCVFDQHFTISEMAQKINKLIILDDSFQNILSTLSLLMINTENGQIHYSGAGDLPLMHYKVATNELVSIQSSGLLLGLMEDGLFDEQLIKMESGDQLLLFTDGLIDNVSDGQKKSDYTSISQQLSSYLGTRSSFEEIKTHMLDKITLDTQLDDVSIIFIEKK